MRSLSFLLLTVILLSGVMADEAYDRAALCASYSGVNSTCGSCIAQGCFYADITGTGMGGVCASTVSNAKSQSSLANNTNYLISSMASLTQCRATQPDLYENIAAFIPIATGIVGLVLFLLIAWIVRPTYAPSTTQQVIVVAPPTEGHDQPLLAPSSSRWILIKQQLTRERMKHHCRRSGCCYKLFIVIVLIVVFVLSIVAVSGGMWSVQINGNRDHDWKSATSAIAYDGYGVHTITRDPQDRDHLIFRWSEYTCNSVSDDSFIRCSLHRIVSRATHGVASLALTCMCIVFFLMVWSIIRCRSLNSISVTFMSLAAISHLVAVAIYAGGCFLLQTRIYHNSEYSTPSSSSYHLYLGVNWNVSVAAFVLNVVLLIPLTRAHIHAIPKPDHTQGRCCRKHKQEQQEQQQQQQQQQSHQGEAAVGIAVAVPMEQPAYNPAVHNPYATGATSYMSPAYQYGSVQTTSAPPAHGYPEI